MSAPWDPRRGPGDAPATAPNPSTAQARVLLDELARCGVRHVVLCPGSRSTALAVAAVEHPDLLLHVALDERGAGYVALGVGRATSQPAAVVVTSGTAVANLLPAVVEADHDRVPLLLLTADRPPELHGVGANQTIEQVGIFGGSPRLTVDLGVAGDGVEEVARWRWTACRAHGVAVGRPVEVPAVVSLDEWHEPGPVHVDVPFREPTVPASDDGRTSAAPFRHPLDGQPSGEPWRRGDDTEHLPPTHVVEDLRDRLAATERGVVVLGGAVADPGPVVALAGALGWPLLAEPHAALPPAARASAAAQEPGPVLTHGTLLLGTRDATRHPPVLALRVGRTTVARETGALLAAVDEVVVLDAHGGWVDHDDDRVTLVRGVPSVTVAALLAALDEQDTAGARRTGRDGGPGEWLGSWQEADRRAAAAVDRVLDAAAGPSEPGVARAVLAALPPGGSLVVGSSMPIRDLDLVAGRRADVTVQANRGASGIDGNVSTALGVAVASGRPTVALVGDLTLLHDATAWHLREDPRGGTADLVVVVLDNDGGGIFSFLPQRQHVDQFERLLATPHGLDLAHLAALHRLGYEPPTALPDDAAVAAAVRTRLAAGGRHLVHVRTDRGENLALHETLRAAVVEALDER